MAGTLEDWAFRVSDGLRRADVDAILTGGACVTIYTGGAYESHDLDFVLRSHRPPGRIRAALEGLGFRLSGGRFLHPDTDFFVEILPPPPSVGEEPIRGATIRRRGGLRLEMLTPTDCVKDRLAAFYHWGDLPSLDQAVLVAAKRPVDLRDVGRWSRAEGKAAPYRTFLTALRGRAKAGGRRSPRRTT